MYYKSQIIRNKTNGITGAYVRTFGYLTLKVD